MKKFKTFSQNHPLLFGFSLIFLYALLSTLTYPVHYLFPETDVGVFIGDAVSKGIIFLCFLALLWRFGWLPASGFTKFRLGHTWLIILLILIYKGFTELYAFTGNGIPILPSSPSSWAESLYLFPASLVEETMYRGLVLLAMISAWGDTKQGVVRSVLLSALLFGSLHLFNALAKPIGMVLFQTLIVALPGILYAALVLSTRSIWPAILLHWLTNAALNAKITSLDSFSESPTIWIVWGISLIPLVLLSFYFLRQLPAQYKIEELEYQPDLSVA